MKKILKITNVNGIFSHILIQHNKAMTWPLHSTCNIRIRPRKIYYTITMDIEIWEWIIRKKKASHESSIFHHFLGWNFIRPTNNRANNEVSQTIYIDLFYILRNNDQFALM
jgi:hypothetical protein